MDEAEGIKTSWRRSTLLVLAITLHNIPEGLAVGVAFGGAAAGVLGAAFVLICQPILPYALSFAAGAMIFVVVEELVPESQHGGNADLATMGAVVGFAVMMVLHVALGYIGA
jgi:ZIP family zinc transporter